MNAEGSRHAVRQGQCGWLNAIRSTGAMGSTPTQHSTNTLTDFFSIFEGLSSVDFGPRILYKKTR